MDKTFNYFDEVSSLLDFSKATCVKPSEQELLKEKDILQKLANFPSIKKNTLIVVNDQYRATPSAMIIRLLRILEKITTPLSFIIATGSHEVPSEEEAKYLTDAKDGDKILYHDVCTQSTYSYGGTTSRGTKVYYNSALDKFKEIITIGSVEPHYFAGFTGGAKSLIPGLASKETITQNHRWASDPNAIQMKTLGNPVFEDIWESASLIRNLQEFFTVQLVNHGDSIFHVSIGNMPEAFTEAKNKSKEFFGRSFDKKFDRIITFAQTPLNYNFYQSQKALDNTKSVLKKGGTLVLVSQCSRGIGSKNFFERLTKLGSAKNVLNELSFEKYELGDHKACRLAQLALNAELLYLGELSKELVATSYMKKITIKELAVLYKSWLSNGERILIDEAGGFTSYDL